MGLDQYLFATPPQAPETSNELWSWRKHANLQGFMAEQWTAQHPGSDQTFNLQCVTVTAELCLEVMERTRQGTLPHSTGCFYGVSTPEKDQCTITAFERALTLIRQGHTVIYTSFW